MDTAQELAPTYGVQPTCRTLFLSRATFYRGRPQPAPAPESSRAPGFPELSPAPSEPSSALPEEPKATTAVRSLAPRCRVPGRALSLPERQTVLDLLHSERFVDHAPAQVYATLLDEGTYHCSSRTMYRLLASQEEVRERRRLRRHPAYQKPELLATKPNQLWSWDITRLLGPTKWTYYYLYVLLDVFSRLVVGWTLAYRESAALAEQLLLDSYTKQGVLPGQLTVHADRGSSMTSKPVALLLSDLGVTKTHSRPHVSNDNPFSESQFKTLKYRPDFPERFFSLEEARQFCRCFFPWYNQEHHHSGLAWLTPETVHYGRTAPVLASRQSTLTSAYQLHPERFVRQAPQVAAPPEAVYINPPVPALSTGQADPLLLQ